jgi:N-acetylglucosaminyl-diphospho-decaprenol L-rhamnosyltransferase
LATSLDIIIVNWNAGAQLQRCLDSIRFAGRDGFELLRVVVVDNASSDDAVSHLEVREFPLTILRNDTNRGFAAACNQGARGSQASYLLFLNPDCTLFEDSLDKPIRYMEQPEHADVGITGVQLLDAEGGVSRSCARFPAPRHVISAALGLAHLSPLRFPDYRMTNWNHLETRKVDHVIGAFMLIRRDVFEQLGGYDERFFVYLEDLDLSLRMTELGFTSVYLASARALHKGGGCSNQAKPKRLFYSLRSRIIYCRKHFGWPSDMGVTFATLLIEPFSRIAYAAARGGVREIGDTLRAYALLLNWLATSTFKRNRHVPGSLSREPTAEDLIVSRNPQWNEDLAPDVAEARTHTEAAIDPS